MGSTFVFMPKMAAIMVSGKVTNAMTVRTFMISFCLVERSELFVSRSSAVVSRWNLIIFSIR